jgi:hypothetical protein
VPSGPSTHMGMRTMPPCQMSADRRGSRLKRASMRERSLSDGCLRYQGSGITAPAPQPGQRPPGARRPSATEPRGLGRG